MSETEILSKLSAIEKGQRKNGAATQAAIGFAIATYMANSINTAPSNLNKVIAAILCFIGIFWFCLNLGKWLKAGK